MKPILDTLRQIKTYLASPVTSDFHFTCKGRMAYELVLDASPSMEQKDYPPSRFAAAKQAANRFLERCTERTPNALVGVIFYSHSARLASELVPIWEGLDRVRQAVDSGRVDNATNITAGLSKAQAEFLTKGSDLTPVIVLLTDGHSNFGPDPVKTASTLKQAGIQIDIIGIGGSPTEVNEPALKRMASVVDGQLRYWFIRDNAALVRKFEALALGKV